MRRMLLGIGILLSMGLVCVGATEVVLFHEEGCPHCVHMEELLGAMQNEGVAFQVASYLVSSAEAQALLPRLLTAYGAEIGPVPLFFVGDVAIVRDTFTTVGGSSMSLTGRAADMEIRRLVAEAAERGAPSPLARIVESATEAVLVLGRDCPDCLRLDELVTSLQAAHPELAVRRIQADDDAGRTLERLEKLYRVRGAAPALFVGDTALVGGTLYPGREKARAFTYSDEDVQVLTAHVEAAIRQKAMAPLEKIRVREKATLWAVIAAALLDSVNPCDFAVMLLLLGRLLVIGKRHKIIWAGLSWSAGVYLTYFLIGYVFYTLLGVTVGTRSLRTPYILAVSSIAILVGLWQMKDLLWYGKWFSIEVPESWKPALKRVTSSVVSLPGIFVAGMVDALFLAPCTSGPYLAILSLLSTTTTRVQGVLMLLLYNLIFILPMIAIALTVHFGLTTTARAERWRTAKMGKLHFITGVVMVALGVGMIIGVQLGYI